jgi:hypothetical protein
VTRAPGNVDSATRSVLCSSTVVIVRGLKGNGVIRGNLLYVSVLNVLTVTSVGRASGRKYEL